MAKIYGNTEIQGTLTLVDGSQANGYVLISDVTGLASWTASSGIGDGNGIYDGSGTVPTSTIATITDTLTFDAGQVKIKGLNDTNGVVNFRIENNSDVPMFIAENDGAFAIGRNSQPNNAQNIHIAYHSASFTPTSSQSVLIGSSVNDNASTGAHVIIGLNAQGAGTTPGVSIGSSSNSATGGVSIGISATVASSSGVSIGANSDAADGVAVGNAAQATGAQSTSIGRTSNATASGSTALGHDADSLGANSVALGQLAVVNASGSQGVAVGYQTLCGAARAIAIGRLSSSTGIDSISIGYEAEILTVANSTAIGVGAAVTAAGAQMIGWKSSPNVTKVTNSVANSVAFGWDTTTPDVLFAKTADMYIAGSGDLAIGHKTPTARVHIQGSGSTSATNALLVENAAASVSFTVQDDGVIVLKSFIKSALPTAIAGGMIRVSDEVGGDTISYSDGSNWRRVSDGAIVS